ncbi:MAG: AMMECR1 domain-containing protein [Treponema sp. GWB1_62_6]|nr:MAG: AMMECR1 domain-containing protein [Treponema sp. GWC1_61_84]OHE64341.1 MAG: AMMECR1 domain-containing protein [Treponema sp. GWA1_62_8]OHE64566.1 MAG: AMMECR1 domain-containing protein [Treponema sp. GWB1_62_6]HCM28333.1 AMMECR1 domain-containing protein [Treponema sp.]
MKTTLNEKQRLALLADARETIAARSENRAPDYGAGRVPEGEELEARGAFVSLHMGHSLRGCIGHMSATNSLVRTIREMSIAAAFEDPRFPPLNRGELDSCSIEISVLSPMEECPDPKEVIVGTHGVYLIHRGRSGVFLPQVPGEQGWDRDEYLNQLCRKAGLEPGAYLETGARLYTFTATVFAERR